MVGRRKTFLNSRKHPKIVFVSSTLMAGLGIGGEYSLECHHKPCVLCATERNRHNGDSRMSCSSSSQAQSMRHTADKSPHSPALHPLQQSHNPRQRGQTSNVTVTVGRECPPFPVTNDHLERISTHHRNCPFISP